MVMQQPGEPGSAPAALANGSEPCIPCSKRTCRTQAAGTSPRKLAGHHAEPVTSCAAASGVMIPNPDSGSNSLMLVCHCACEQRWRHRPGRFILDRKLVTSSWCQVIRLPAHVPACPPSIQLCPEQQAFQHHLLPMEPFCTQGMGEVPQTDLALNSFEFLKFLKNTQMGCAALGKPGYKASGI